MENLQPPQITSFVLRFVHNEADSPQEPGLPLRGAIRHIQTDQELTFTRWQDAVAFIQRFVPLQPED